MALADLFVYLDDVRYTKQDWRNRNRILNLQGEPEYITVPVRAGADQLLIKDVQIASDATWKRKLINKLSACYRQAEHAEDYLPRIAKIVTADHEKLVDLNYDLMALLCDAFQIDTPTVLASDAGIAATDKNQRLIELCLHHGADTLYDGAAAAEFIDLERFASAGIKVVFQAYKPQHYPQGQNSFVSHLSSIDALLWQGDQAAAILRASTITQELRAAS